MNTLGSAIFTASVYVAMRTGADLDEVRAWIDGRPGYTLDSAPGGTDQYLTIRRGLEAFGEQRQLES